MIILLVDDSSDEIFFFRRALSTVDPSAKVIEMPTAIAASRFLQQHPPHENASVPDIVVSDSVMTHDSGEELLQWMRSCPELAHIPFVLFTGNTDPQVKKCALDLGAAKVIAKPVQFDEQIKAVREILALASKRGREL